jgi:hypothetical protein
MNEPMRTRLIALTMTLVLASACSSEPRQTAQSNGATPAAGDQNKTTDNEGAPEKDKDKNKKDETSGGSAGTSKNGGGSGRSGSDGGNGSVDSEEHSGGDEGDAEGTAAYPAAGTYTYDQSGFEEFCTTTCEREDLPPQQSAKVRYKKRSDTQATVVSEVRASNSRVARTTFKFTPKQALITDVFTHFEYEGFEFSDSYHPQPPVEALRFPLRAGMKWSGSWKDKTSGDYSISVGDIETVSVNGQSIDAFRIETDTTFKGQFDGRSVVTVWFDSETKSPVKTDGYLNVKSAFGRYNTEFQTVLASGPGY